MPIPKDKHLEHLNKRWINHLGDWIEHTVKHKNITIHITAILLLVISSIGIFQIETTGSLIEDMPKKAPFFKDIIFYEKEFNGVMPLEIVIDTKKPKGALKTVTLKRINELQETIEEIPELSKPVSVVNLVKYANQAFYNGNPDFYDLPNSKLEEALVLTYVKNSTQKGNEVLEQAYKDIELVREENPDVSADVYLFFSVNKSKHFCGVCKMKSNVKHGKERNDLWKQSGKWPG